MKKTISFGIILALVIGLIAAIPVFAKTQPHEVRALFEADLIDLDGNLYGELWVRDNPASDSEWIKVEVAGADEYSTYNLMYSYYTDTGPTGWVDTGMDLVTDEEGEGKIDDVAFLPGDGVYAAVAFGLQEDGGAVLCATGFVITGD